MNVNGGFGVNEPGVARLAERSLRMIWHPFRQFLAQFGPVMAVPSVVVHNMEGYSTGLCGPH